MEDIPIYKKKAVRLACGYDAEKLKLELDCVVKNSEWFERVKNVWHAIPLRSVAGGTTASHVSHIGTSLMAPADQFKDTKWMEHCPYLREIVHSLGPSVFKVRFMKVNAKSSLQSHVDNFPHKKIVRLHLAVRSDPQVTMTVEDKTWHIKEGELWFANVKRVHSVKNPSAIDRVHVVFDIAWSDQLEQLYQQAQTLDENIIS